MEKKQNVPALRFQRFSGEWGKYNLNMLSGLITKGTTPLDKSGKGNVNFVKIENIDANTGKIHTTQKISQKEHNGYLKRSQLKENDILFSIAGTLGRVAVVNTNILPANTNQALAIIRLKKGHFKYIKTYLQGKAVANFLKANPTVGAQPNLSLAQVGSLEIIMPEKSEEQGNIADFFQYLDELIFRTVSKIQKIQQFRQAMLTKLFPREGEAEPELRFRGFSGKWEMHSFANVTVPAGEKNRDNLPYESYSITNDKGFILQDEKFENGGTMREADKRMYYIVPPKTFAYNPARINIGSIGYQDLGKKVIVSSLYEVFQTTETIDDRFLWHWFHRDEFHRLVEQFQEGGVRLYFYYDKLCMCSLLAPTIEEQKQIGKFFDQLDSFISLQQEKLERMQRLKAALLEKMFI